MIYLKLYENHEGYASAMDAGRVEFPNVSVCVNNEHVHYREFPPFESIDLGLTGGTLWATTNVGAMTKFDVGDYYQWGSLVPTDYNQKADVSDELLSELVKTYKYAEIGSGPIPINFTKYTSTGETLDFQDDIAYLMSDGEYRMPTEAEIGMLQDCQFEYDADNGGIWVYKSPMTAQDGLFFPTTLYSEDTGATPPWTLIEELYWSNELSDDGISLATAAMAGRYSEDGSDTEVGIGRNVGFRLLGCLVRPVKMPANAGKTDDDEIREFMVEEIGKNPPSTTWEVTGFHRVDNHTWEMTVMDTTEQIESLYRYYNLYGLVMPYQPPRIEA